MNLSGVKSSSSQNGRSQDSMMRPDGPWDPPVPSSSMAALGGSLPAPTVTPCLLCFSPSSLRELLPNHQNLTQIPPLWRCVSHLLQMRFKMRWHFVRSCDCGGLQGPARSQRFRLPRQGQPPGSSRQQPRRDTKPQCQGMSAPTYSRA